MRMQVNVYLMYLILRGKMTFNNYLIISGPYLQSKTYHCLARSQLLWFFHWLKVASFNFKYRTAFGKYMYGQMNKPLPPSFLMDYRYPLNVAFTITVTRLPQLCVTKTTTVPKFSEELTQYLFVELKLWFMELCVIMTWFIPSSKF